jgi:protocatechuate 3,4-dioxygenase, alpha subunit
VTRPNAALLTPSQTVGPFFSDCLLRDGAVCDDLAPDATAADRIVVYGTVLDGSGAGVPDAVLELWQDGSRFGRVGTDGDGRFRFSTVRPTDVESPHISVAVFARGLLNHLYTRIYFADASPATDPVMSRVPAERRATLLARAEDATTYRFDVVLQGPGETVFLDFA